MTVSASARSAKPWLTWSENAPKSEEGSSAHSRTVYGGSTRPGRGVANTSSGTAISKSGIPGRTATATTGVALRARRPTFVSSPLRSPDGARHTQCDRSGQDINNPASTPAAMDRDWAARDRDQAAEDRADLLALLRTTERSTDSTTRPSKVGCPTDPSAL